jgi:hypothetical protein
MLGVVSGRSQCGSPSPLEGEGREGGRSRLSLTSLSLGAALTPLLPEALRTSGVLPLKGGGALFLSAQQERAS